MPKYKKNVPTNTISRDMVSLSKDTENIYETVMIIAKRANQIAQETKQELEAKLQEFAVYTDDQQEMVENEEQIEISRQYERMPKPTLIAAKEYEDCELYHNIAGRSKK
ncbi:DNA-directed RNA polymerase subunit omega [Porphyromonas sp.]